MAAEATETTTVVDAIGAQAARTPDAPAVVSSDGALLPFGELWGRAGALAETLRSCGAGTDRVVGILAERSVELVVAILGVLRSGAAYLPLEPTYPLDRLRLMVDESHAVAVVTQAASAQAARELSVPVVRVDADHRPADPPPTAGPSSLAYVLYTSGSTGRPKGVMVEHAALFNRLEWMQRAFALTGEDVVLQKTPFSFDVSIWEFLWPLLAGVPLAVVPPFLHIDARYLRRFVDDHAVTVAHFVPSMLKAFCDRLPMDACPTLRLVIASGEVLPPAVAAEVLAKTNARLCNLYGPTEAAIDVTAWECELGAIGATIPIGRPIDNVDVFVIDEHLQEVPTETRGELAIAGVCLARGYMERPDLTEERFVAVRRRDGTICRAYRTGDAGFERPDGVLEYLGRIDRQVKLRGYRIEPAEIELALLAEPGVAQAAVVAVDGDLVAYVTPVGVGDLRGSLQRRLPAYMVPRLVVVDTLPTTPNGKVDLAALEDRVRRSRAE